MEYKEVAHNNFPVLLPQLLTYPEKESQFLNRGSLKKNYFIIIYFVDNLHYYDLTAWFFMTVIMNKNTLH